MSLNSLTPVLRTWDLAGTMSFYRDVLGFQVTGHSEEFAWARLERDRVCVMLSGANDHLPETAPALTGSLYITCDDVDEEWSRLVGQVQVCYEPANFHYGMREFGVFDNNGYLLCFAMPVPTAAQ